MMIIIAMMLVIWATALAITVFGTQTTLKRLATHPPHLDAPFNLYPVTVLKPLKGAESGLSGNLATFFQLDYPKYELIFSLADESDPAHPIISRLIQKHPHVSARLIIGDFKVGANPKINNMVKGYQEAQYDWLLISDSNIRVRPDYLKRLVAQLDPGVGIITSLVAGHGGEGMGGLLEASFLNTFYARGMGLAFSAGMPIVMGKSMMFRKSTAQRFGGIKILSRYLAEDYMAGEAIRHLGLKTVLSCDPIVQHIGTYSLKNFWSRHIRWGRLRKAQSPLTFFIEPFFGCLGSGLLGTIAVKHWPGVSPTLFVAFHLCIWSLCDLMLMKRLGQKLEARLPLLWFMRELLSLPLWAHIALGSTVDWRGRKLKLQSGGILEAEWET
jgi:ceramide glucosyltransferase